MSTLKAQVIEIIQITKECPEHLQTMCFEMLMTDLLRSRTATSVEPPKTSPSGKGSAEIEARTLAEHTKSVSEEIQRGQEDIAETELHAKMRHFMKKCGIDIHQLNNLFYRDGGEILSLYEDLKTTRMAEGQVRISLLQALRNAMTTGEFCTTIEAIRNEAQARKFYDPSNFTRNLNNNVALYDFEKYDKTITAVTLSEQGKSELATVIAELQ